jgi:hypothetical protein
VSSRSLPVNQVYLFAVGFDGRFHLKVLERAGLILRGHEAQWRPCTLNARTLREVSEWAETYRSLWDASLENLEAYLDEIQATENVGKQNPGDEK